MLFYIAAAVFLPALHKASAAGLILMHRLASLNLDVALAAAAILVVSTSGYRTIQ